MLAPNPRLRSNRPTAIEHRSNMLNLACAGERYLVPDLSEVHSRQDETRTVDTVTRLGGTATHPVIWILGDDVAVNLKDWVRYDELRTRTSFFLIRRTNSDLKELEDDFEFVDEARLLVQKSSRIFISRTQMPVISSTKVRSESLNSNLVGQWLHPDVEDYIIKLSLYKS